MRRKALKFYKIKNVSTVGILLPMLPKILPWNIGGAFKKYWKWQPTENQPNILAIVYKKINRKKL